MCDEKRRTNINTTTEKKAAGGFSSNHTQYVCSPSPLHIIMKRFTETSLWDDPWFRKLPLHYKLFWKYICDKCNNAGIWVKDFETASYFIGSVLNEEDTLSFINSGKERIVVLSDDKWYINDFISFQFGHISEESNIGKSVIKLIQECISKGIEHPFDSRLTGIERDIGKGKGKGRGNGNLNKGITSEIVDDLNLVLGTSYKHSSRKTRELIQARLNEGFTVEDFKKVHRIKLKEWGNDEKMVKYLRPETLYGTKFESYLNQKEITTRLSENGVSAYLIGQEWLRKQNAGQK